MTYLSRESEDGKMYYNRGVWSIRLSLAFVLGLKTMFAWAHIVFLYGKKKDSHHFLWVILQPSGLKRLPQKKTRTGTSADFLQSQQLTWKWHKGTSNYFSQININMNTCNLADHLAGLCTGTWDVLEAGQCTRMNSATRTGSETGG